MHELALRVSFVVWAAFIAIWVVAAFRVKRVQSSEPLSTALSYRMLTVLAFGLIAYSNRLGPIFSRPIVAQTRAVSLVAIGCSVVGLLVCIFARITIGTNWSSSVVVKKNHELVQKGPYGYVRHPIYTGILLMILADVLLNGRIGGMLSFALF